MFKQYQEVELSHDMMSDELLGDPVQLKEGQKGVIVEIHSNKGVPDKGYDVEFFDDEGNTVAVMIVKEGDIRVLGAKTRKENVLPQRDEIPSEFNT